MQLRELVSYLDDYLATNSITDYPGAINGLQVESSRNIKKIAVAVDACQFTIEAAVAAGADMLIVHHGLFWGQKAPLTGTYYRRIATIIQNDLAVYSNHLPLDAHPEIGNCPVLARQLGLTIDGGFGHINGVPIGVIGTTEISRADLVDSIRRVLGVDPLLIAHGPSICHKVGVMTGGAGTMIAEAQAAGCDTFITGEGAHHTHTHTHTYNKNDNYTLNFGAMVRGASNLIQ